MQHIPELKYNSSMPGDSYQPSCIRMTLENSDLWKSFHNIGTEMIITKHGRRMFPHCCISITGLQPFIKYVIMVDMVPVDSYKYRWKMDQWEVAGSAEPPAPCRTYMHPDSPALGSHWMKQSLSFLKMKLTNNILDQHGHIILHSMHRYCPRFHLTQADSPYTVSWGPFQTFSFPEMTFTAVTAYQNPKLTKLKIDHNPFAKGFREGGIHSHSKRCRPNRSPSAKKAATNKKALRESPSGLQRMPSASQSRQGEKNQICTQQTKRGDLPAWPQDAWTSPHGEPPEQQEYDYSCEEQMVPVSTAYQPYRSSDYSNYLRPANQDPTHSVVNPPPPPPPPPLPLPLLKAEQPTANPQQHGYRHYPQHHNHAGDWSQYPLFPYSCW